ncbi:high mobility group box domain-containing protein, partial [Rhodocollybia butyracea]
MSTQTIQSPFSDTSSIAGHDFMATSEGHNLSEEIPHTYPVSIHFSPNLSPSVEHNGPDVTPPTERPVRHLAPRKGSPRRETHIPRPRNAFIIFRSEYHSTKITTDIEHDARHISRIVGHLWNNMSEEDKAPYRLMAENEKLEHQQRYPNYRFTP